ncbi:MAG: molybdate ABC transporter permease subunit [Alphaproteobacteria bacterium]|jgi:molybdate transport system permease protein
MEYLTELWPVISLTLKLASVTTVLLLLIGSPIAWFLARCKSGWKEPLAALIAMPLVLPPTALGFYLLLALGPDGPGGWLANLWGGRSLAFSFTGLVIGSMIYSLPFVVQPIRNAFEAIREPTLEAARTLGASPTDIFFRLALPLAQRGILTGAILAFAHTIGEFGVILMIGGDIPGETRVASVALYDFVEALEWGKAHILAAGMIAFSFLVVLTALMLSKTQRTS